MRINHLWVVEGTVLSDEGSGRAARCRFSPAVTSRLGSSMSLGIRLENQRSLASRDCKPNSIGIQTRSPG